jgi:hypothetical protein
MINDISDLTITENSKLKLNEEYFDLNKVIN